MYTRVCSYMDATLLRSPWAKIGLTWDQAPFSFRFENYIPVGKAKRKEYQAQFQR